MRRVPLSDPWAGFGRGLALTNLAFWSANLGFFIIPLFLPRAFEKHFELMRKIKEEGAVSSEGSEQRRDQHIKIAPELGKVEEDDSSSAKNKII